MLIISTHQIHQAERLLYACWRLFIYLSSTQFILLTLCINIHSYGKRVDCLLRPLDLKKTVLGSIS